MKGFIVQLRSSHLYPKAMHMIKLVSFTGLAQVTIQAVSFASGVLVIRLLPTQEYALYTLTNTMLGTMVLLADGGISVGVMAQGGRVWQDRTKLGAVLATGLALRKKFAVISLLLSVPALLYLLRHHNASWLMATLLILSLIPAFFTSLSGTLLEVVPKLRQDILPLQRIQVSTYFGRLGLLVICLFIFPYASIAILAAGLPQIWANLRLRKISAKFADVTQPSDPTINRDILKKVKRLLPDAIYYCLWCQFAVWLISFFGSTEAVAQLGALGRLAVALTLLSTLFSALVLPRFSRLPDSNTLLLKKFIQIEIGLLAIAASVVAFVYLFSGQILMVLGASYENLGTEMVLMMVGKCLSFIATSSFLLCTSRGWVINPAISISISVLSAAAGIYLIDISTLQGIFILDILTAIVQVVMHISYGLFNIRKVHEPAMASLVTHS